MLFIIEDWNAKVGSQDTLGVTVKFELGIQNEAAEPKWKQHPAGDVSGGESKVQCCKEELHEGTWNESR